MIQKKLCLIAGMFTVCFCGVIVAGEPVIDRSAQYNDHPTYNFHGEIDKTDIYAIPLDNSEEEQNEELSEFEKESKEYEATKKTERNRLNK
ncbi:MAG: hypothetical protein H0X29_01785 [Parachlamydiaceae bacterium]|nr:hypothetical protein [Parachlamydiaceae bacterium]